MIDFKTFEKIIKHSCDKRLDIESYNYSRLVNFEEILKENPTFLSRLESEQRFQIMSYIVLQNKKVLDFTDEPKKLVNDFFDQYIERELPEIDISVSVILKLLLNYNKNDFNKILTWIESYIKKVNSTVNDYNKNEHFINVFNEIAIDDLKDGDNFVEKSLYIDFSEQEFKDLILSELVTINYFSAAKQIVINWIEQNKKIINALSLYDKIKVYRLFPDIYGEDEVYDFVKSELLSIKESLPSEEAYKNLGNILNMGIYNSDISKNVLTKLIIEEKLLDKKYFSKTYLESESLWFLISSIFSIIFRKEFEEIYDYLEIDYALFFEVSLKNVKPNKRKSLLFSKLDINNLDDENDILNKLKVTALERNIEIPRKEHYILLSEFPELGKSLVFERLKTEDIGTNSFDIFVFYLMYAKEDLSLSDEHLELLKLNFKK